jgi:polysaccharide export outer membrane protein
MSRHNFPFVAITALFLAAAPHMTAQENYLAANVKPPITEKLTHIQKVNDAFQADLMNANARYRLYVSDIISLKFPHAPEFDQTVSVEPGGFVSLVNASSIRVEGLTTPELVEAIQQEYSKTLRDPTVIVELKDFNRPYFIVLGEVNRPGKYDLRGFTSVTDALASAGGVKNTARYSRVLLFRRASNDWYQVKALDLKRLLRRSDFEEDAELRPGDMLFVPQNLLSKVRSFLP